MAHAVEHRLGHRLLAGCGSSAPRSRPPGKAEESPLLLGRRSLEVEGSGRRRRIGRGRKKSVDPLGLFPAEIAEAEVGRTAQIERRPAYRPLFERDSPAAPKLVGQGDNVRTHGVGKTSFGIDTKAAGAARQLRQGSLAGVREPWRAALDAGEEREKADERSDTDCRAKVQSSPVVSAVERAKREWKGS